MIGQESTASDENSAKSSTDECAKVPALIPLWDVANHANGTITTNYNPEEAQVEGATMDDVKKDEQIFMFYGNRNNANLLIHNGYEIALLICEVNWIWFNLNLHFQIYRWKQSIGQCSDSFGIESIRSVGETANTIIRIDWNCNAQWKYHRFTSSTFYITGSFSICSCF